MAHSLVAEPVGLFLILYLIFIVYYIV